MDAYIMKVAVTVWIRNGWMKSENNEFYRRCMKWTDEKGTK